MPGESASPFVSRGDFLAGCRRRFGTFTLPHSGQSVRYRSLSEAEFARFEMQTYKPSQEGEGLETDPDALLNARERLIVLCLCDEAGNRLLTDADVDAISQLDAGDTGALYDVLREHCGIARRVREARARQEALKKSSPPIAAGDSPSALPPTAES